MVSVRSMLTCAVVALSAAAAWAQTPTRPATASTPAQETVIRRGVGLHDQGKFDEAIAAYESVLKESPGNTTALYELAYSLIEKKDYARALETATRGTQYQSDELPMFFDLVASVHDLMGNPQQAIAAYKRGIAVVPNAATLHYNMGITYLESLKDPVEARRALEKAAAIDPAQGQVHLMLGQVFQSNGYLVPSFFAFATALVYEPGGSQATRAYGFLRAALRGPAPAAPGAGMKDAPRTAGPAKIDEGDYRALEQRLGNRQQAFIAALDAGTGEIDALVPQVKAFFQDLATRDLATERSTFVGRHYLPYFVEIQKRGLVEPFLFWAIQRAPVQGVKEWLTAHDSQVTAFVEWTKAYTWPTP